MKQKILKWKIEQRHESGYDVTANGSVRIAFVKEQQMKYVIRKKMEDSLFLYYGSFLQKCLNSPMFLTGNE